MNIKELLRLTLALPPLLNIIIITLKKEFSKAFGQFVILTISFFNAFF